MGGGMKANNDAGVGTGLYQKHRPKTLEDVVGQAGAIKIIEGLFRGSTFPRALLFSGPSGTGKTTLARILQERLGCSPYDFEERNSADFRGIDSVREIRSRINLRPVGMMGDGTRGRVRIWLIDECFPPGSLVSTPTGDTPIEQIRPGQKINNINGEAFVKKVFCNVVDVARIVRVHLSNGRHIITTAQHEFLTHNGWVVAKDLEGHCIYGASGYTVGNAIQQEPANDHLPVRILSTNLLQEQSLSSENPNSLLLQKMCWSASSDSQSSSSRELPLPGVRTNHLTSTERDSCVLWAAVSCTQQDETTRDSSLAVQRGYSSEDTLHATCLCCDRSREETTTESLRTDAETKPSTRPNCHRKNESNEAGTRLAQCVAGHPWGQWYVHTTTGKIVHGVGGRLGKGAGDSDRDEKSLSVQVSTGHREDIDQDLCRGRWERTQDEQSYITRQEKDRLSESVRVVRVEVYKRGCRWAAELGTISDCGDGGQVVNFYDLEIEGHPSYFVFGAPVHNCHQITPDGQDAMLKLLEDAPSHVLFFLATTNPGKLKPTVKTRCTEITLKGVSDKDIRALVKKVALKEGLELPDEVADRIAEFAESSPRKALVLLESCYLLDTVEDMLEAIERGDQRSQGIELARCLMDQKATWPKVAGLLRSLDDDPEGVRRLVLSYAQTILLSEKGNSEANLARAYMILSVFRYDIFASGKPGLTAACWELLAKARK